MGNYPRLRDTELFWPDRPKKKRKVSSEIRPSGNKEYNQNLLSEGRIFFACKIID
jgi:hypothetical protein